MTTRPTRSFHTRPNSAIYLGTDPIQLSSTPPSIPDLPEPPSPVSSSGSGLPSPPATNSTGSGSTGDPASIALRNKSSRSGMLDEDGLKSFHSAHNNSRDMDEDDDNDNDNDEDHTARLNRQTSTRGASESALQRVKSLAQRNKMVLDKLASYSRNTPSPSGRTVGLPNNGRQTPAYSDSPSLAALTSSSRRRGNSIHQESGSETERESLHVPEHSVRSASPGSSTTPHRSVTPVGSAATRLRLKSAPTSPAKALYGVTIVSSQAGPSTLSPSRRRKRASLAVTERDGEEEADIAQLALAAVASSRRSPTLSKWQRQPLPFEFRDSDTDSKRSGMNELGANSRNSQHSNDPFTPHRAKTLASRPSTAGKAATVRDRHQMRWMSEDLSSTSSSHSRDFDDTEEDEDLSGSGRKQTLRGGSAESALTVGRSLIGEGLRAAGIGRKQPADAAGEGESILSSRRRVDRSPVRAEEDRRRSGSRLDLRTPARDSTIGRSATSMASYREEEVRESPAPNALRNHRSAYPLSARDRDGPPGDRAGSSLARYDSLNGTVRERERYSSPYGVRRSITVPGVAASSNAGGTGNTSTPATNHQSISEHTRLMMEGLNMFETNLGRIPQLNSSQTSSTSHNTAAELVRSAHAIVQTAERLNDMMKAGTNEALEEQVQAEVGDSPAGAELSDTWRRVGSDYRDGLRASDELVRSVTHFMLGVGRLVRDLVGGAETHNRSVSFDDEITGRRSHGSLSPDSSSNGTGTGNRRSDSRLSWESVLKDRDRDGGREDALRRLSGRLDSSAGERPPSALRGDFETPSKLAPRTNGILESGSMRRLYSPREYPRKPLVADNSHETIMAEPSPTPAARSMRASLATLNIPDTPSHRRTQTVDDTVTSSSSSNNSGSRPPTNGGFLRPTPRRTSINAGRSPLFPTISTPNTTTALTTSSPVAFPLTRTDSSRSNKSIVTFSKPNGSALSGLQEQDHRLRTTSEIANDEFAGAIGNGRRSVRVSSAAHAADRSAAASGPISAGGRR